MSVPAKPGRPSVISERRRERAFPMTREAMETLTSGAVPLGADALDVAREILHTVSRHRGNKQAWRELAKRIEHAGARGANTAKTGYTVPMDRDASKRRMGRFALRRVDISSDNLYSLWPKPAMECEWRKMSRTT
jgi:hypothetical protein